MDVAQLFSDFLLGLSRVSDFFSGVDKFWSGVKFFLDLPADTFQSSEGDGGLSSNLSSGDTEKPEA